MGRMPNGTILMENALIWMRILTKHHVWYTSLARCSGSTRFAPNLKSQSPPCTVKKAWMNITVDKCGKIIVKIRLRNA